MMNAIYELKNIAKNLDNDSAKLIYDWIDKYCQEISCEEKISFEFLQQDSSIPTEFLKERAEKLIGRLIIKDAARKTEETAPNGDVTIKYSAVILFKKAKFKIEKYKFGEDLFF